MILDKIDKIEHYNKEYPQLTDAIFAAQKLWKEKFASGTYLIDGKNIHAIKSRYETQPRSERYFENHRKFIDIQMLISGQENIDVSNPIKQEALIPYSEEDDIEFYTGNNKFSTFLLERGNFVVLFPDEWHRPCLNYNNTVSLSEKIVVKVSVKTLRKIEKEGK